MCASGMPFCSLLLWTQIAGPGMSARNRLFDAWCRLQLSFSFTTYLRIGLHCFIYARALVAGVGAMFSLQQNFGLRSFRCDRK